MRNIAKVFKQCQPFIGYITAGDGGIDYSEQAALSLIKGGVDILELGVPFTDPIADGPVIQKGAERALEQGVTLSVVLDLVGRLRKKTDVPIILMSYYNPVLQAGETFLSRAHDVGVDGLIIVDLPIEEADGYKKTADSSGLDTIFLISPATPTERIKRIDTYSSGFLYYVCQRGTTGIRSAIAENFHQKIREIKAHCSLPVAAGFGISNRETAQEVLQSADGFIVGSLFVKAIEEGATPDELCKLAQSIDPRRGG